LLKDEDRLRGEGGPGDCEAFFRIFFVLPPPADTPPPPPPPLLVDELWCPGEAEEDMSFLVKVTLCCVAAVEVSGLVGLVVEPDPTESFRWSLGTGSGEKCPTFWDVMLLPPVAAAVALPAAGVTSVTVGGFESGLSEGTSTVTVSALLLLRLTFSLSLSVSFSLCFTSLLSLPEAVVAALDSVEVVCEVLRGDPSRGKLVYPPLLCWDSGEPIFTDNSFVGLVLPAWRGFLLPPTRSEDARSFCEAVLLSL
jgi:hypothetical protein